MDASIRMIALALVIAGLLLSSVVGKEDKKDAKSKVDRLLVSAQKICPVCGEELGSRGKPVKAMADEQIIFLCSEDCMQKEISKEHWQQVIDNLAKAQGRCPVMNRELPENAASVIVNHRMIFVCCKPCTRKIESNPDKYLSKVDKLLEESLAQAQSDETEKR